MDVVNVRLMMLFPSLLLGVLVLDVDFERWIVVMVNLSLELNLRELLSGVVIAVVAEPLPLRLRTSRGDGGTTVWWWLRQEELWNGFSIEELVCMVFVLFLRNIILSLSIYIYMIE